MMTHSQAATALRTRRDKAITDEGPGVSASVTTKLDTFPRLLLRHAAERGERPAIREKDLGIWQTWTWAQVLEEVRALSGGLASLGFKRGDHLAIVGDNRPRLYWSISAAQMVGGIPVPLYQDAVAAEMSFPLQNAEIEIAIVEDQEQVDKLLELLPQCPKLKYIVYDDPRGLRNYAEPQLISFEALQERGRGFNAKHPGYLDAEIAKCEPSDTAAMLYTSGTTGVPKGVVLSHSNLIFSGNAYIQLDGITENEELLAYMPLAWIGQNAFSYTESLIAGFCVSCPESAETTMIDVREVGPTFYFAPPAVLEGMLTRVMVGMEDAGWIKRSMFHYFMGVARRVGAKLLAGSEQVSLFDRCQYSLGKLLVYGPLRNRLGMSRVRIAYTFGEAIGPDLFVFYRSLGVNLKQLYASTETSAVITVHRNGEVRSDTVGPPLPGVEVRIADNGEVLVKSPGVFQSYYKNPEATAEVKDADGWFHTGDAGFFDEDGHLRIIDRAKDVGRLKDGTLFAPKYLENKLKFFPYIKEVVALGHERDFATAMINIDVTAVGDWAERRNLPYAGYTDLAGKEAVYELIWDCVVKANLDLSGDAKLAGSQIKRFVILHKELDADDGELTRTRKVRRRIIADKYAKIIEALYSDSDHVEFDAQVKFEDGRSGTIHADLKIWDAKIFKDAAHANQDNGQ
jgi:long-chain acyl-CoA synthetase